MANTLPTLLDDSAANISPYDIGYEIYKLCADYFSNKWDLKVVENFPEERCAGPTITWRILRRTPGGGKNNIMQSRGPTYTHDRSVDEFGQYLEIHTQTHQITYEFAIFGNSNPEVNAVAWDWENAMLDVIGPLQVKFPGLTMAFESQQPDSAMTWRIQDEIMVRYLRYLIVLPIRYKVILPELRNINIKPSLVTNSTSTGRITREANDNNEYHITPPTGNKVTGIIIVQKQSSTDANPVKLYPGVDYQVVVKKDLTVYIKWLSEGAPPAVGDSFFVIYNFGPSNISMAVQGQPKTRPESINDNSPISGA